MSKKKELLTIEMNLKMLEENYGRNNLSYGSLKGNIKKRHPTYKTSKFLFVLEWFKYFEYEESYIDTCLLKNIESRWNEWEIAFKWIDTHWLELTLGCNGQSYGALDDLLATMRHYGRIPEWWERGLKVRYIESSLD